MLIGIILETLGIGLVIPALALITQNDLADKYPILMPLLAVSGLAVLVFVMIGQSKSTENMLPVLGLFAATAFRLMPSVNRILGALQNLRYSLPVIDVLYKELLLINTTKSQHDQQGKLLPFDNMLSIKQVSFCYPTTKNLVLSS